MAATDNVTITVFADTIVPIKGDDNLREIVVKKDVFVKWFMANVKDYFRGDDESITDIGLIDEWLLEYTADETTTLYEFALQNNGLVWVY